MSYRQLGHSGLKVSPLALGTMQFGWTADEVTSFAVLDAYVAENGNFIDTADIYSNWVPGNPGGISEKIIGKWLKARSNRDSLVIATKVRGKIGENPMNEGLSRRHILKSVEDSLRRLQTDYIDLYQVHWFDKSVPIEETLSALNNLIERGYVRYIGASNYSAWRLVEALLKAERFGFQKFISLQPEYSLVQPVRANFERELAGACEHFGIGVIPYSPLAGGFLTGKYQKDSVLPESVRATGIQRRFFSAQNFEILQVLGNVARERSATMSQIALAWLLAKPSVAAPIIGANSVKQLLELMKAPEIELLSQEIEDLNQASDWVRARTDG